LLRLQFLRGSYFNVRSRDREAGNPDRRKGFCRGVIRVLIVAASPLILAGLQSLLADSGVDIVGSARISSLLPSKLDDMEPDVLLVETSAEARQAFVDEMVEKKSFEDIRSSCWRRTCRRVGLPKRFVPACARFAQ